MCRNLAKKKWVTEVTGPLEVELWPKYKVGPRADRYKQGYNSLINGSKIMGNWGEKKLLIGIL